MVDRAVIFAAAVVLILILLWSCKGAAGKSPRERYGPPPGMVRAIDHNELPDDRGWPGMDKVYNANTASSISHMVERSA
jgi:hypothetical protein